MYHLKENINSRRVGLLTLPLSNNYGGILQMIALNDVLKQEGYEPVLLDKMPRYQTSREQILAFLGRIPLQNIRGARSRALAARKHRSFYQSHLGLRTGPVKTARDIEREIERLGVSTVVVGSDQVWRLGYQKDAKELNYFLNFGGPHLRRVSYAASFGHGAWKDPSRSKEITDCIARFDAVSVREQSGQTICSVEFKRHDAMLVLDPTLLHGAEYYRKFFTPTTASSGVLAYVLDRQDDARKLSDTIAQQRGNLPIRILSPSAREYVSISDWLSEFANADFVVTDSFHGTIFSILFRKPFLTLLNSRRGLDRFTTLFDTFGLADRGLTDWDGTPPAAIATDPDFEAISRILEVQRESSRSFLRNAMADPV